MNKTSNKLGRSQNHRISKSEIITFVVAPASDHASGLNLQGLVDLINKNSEFKIRIVFCKDYAEAMDALIKGKAKIPDYIQLRNKDMVLVDYFRADRPIDKLRNYKIKSPDNQIIKYINSLPFGKLEPLNIS